MSFEWGTIVKTINWTLVFNLINFAILLLLLRWLLFKPALRYLDKRREVIHGHMEAARQSEEQAADLQQEREVALAAARDETRKMIDESRLEGERIIADAKQAARSAAERLTADALQEIEQQREATLAELREAYADVAVMGAARVLDREINQDDHQRFLDDLLSELNEELLRTP